MGLPVYIVRNGSPGIKNTKFEIDLSGYAGVFFFIVVVLFCFYFLVR